MIYTKMYTAKYIPRFHGKITGNQLSVNFQLFLQAPVNIFKNQAQYSSKRQVLFLAIRPLNPIYVFSGAVGRILTSENVLQVDARKNNGK